MLGYLSLDIICSSKLTVSVRFLEQIMSTDKYPSIFSRQMKAIVYRYRCKFKIMVPSKAVFLTKVMAVFLNRASNSKRDE